jgi:dynein heavy chain, axonemal
VEDVQEIIDPTLEPVLLKKTFKEGSKKMIHFGASPIDLDKNFMLYLTTKLPNPHFLPEVFIRTTVINFTVTELGLEEQLLAEIVKKENSELEKVKSDIIKILVSDQENLRKVEDSILNKLESQEGSILDSNELVENLNESKVKKSLSKIYRKLQLQSKRDSNKVSSQEKRTK